MESSATQAERYAPLLRDYVASGRAEDLAAMRSVGTALAQLRVGARAVVEVHADAMARLCEGPPAGTGPVLFARLSEAEGELIDAFEKAKEGIVTPLPESWRRAIAEDSSVGELVEALAHELRMPLAPILAWAEMGAAQRLDPEMSQAAAQVIERSARSLLRTIDDVGALSRLSGDRPCIEREAVDLRMVVQRAVRAQVGAAELRGVDLRFSAPSSPLRVVGEPRWLEQAVANLVSNGIKFTAGAGSVEVIVEAVSASARVVVRDTGCGIDAVFLEPDAHESADVREPTARRHSGLGLGLAVARALVEEHGGTLRIERGGRGVGTLATLELPVEAHEYGLEIPGGAGESLARGPGPRAI